MAATSRSLRTQLRDARRAAGQSVVEFAIILAVLLPLTIGVVDLGRAYFDYDLLAHAVNEGARFGSFYPTAADRKTQIRNTVRTASGRLNLPTANVTIRCFNGVTTAEKDAGNSGGCTLALNDVVEVAATSTFTPITPFVSALIPGGTLTLWASSRRTYQ
jgi:Flp pilus assembly protein TadG